MTQSNNLASILFCPPSPRAVLPPEMSVRFVPSSAVPIAAAAMLAMAAAVVFSAFPSGNRPCELDRAYDSFAANPIDEFQGFPEHAMLKTNQKEAAR